MTTGALAMARGPFFDVIGTYSLCPGYGWFPELMVSSAWRSATRG